MNRDSKLTRFLVVEGIPGAGKSTLIDALVRQHVSAAPARKIRTLVSLTQNHTWGPLRPGDDAGTLTKLDNLRLLQEIESMLCWLVESAARASMPQPYILVDSLHLTHCVRPGLVQWEDVAGFDGTLTRLGAKLLFLRVSPAAIWQRIIENAERTAFRDGYARRFGATRELIHSHFVREQEEMELLFERSALEKHVVDADQPLADYLEMAHALWMSH